MLFLISLTITSKCFSQGRQFEFMSIDLAGRLFRKRALNLTPYQLLRCYRAIKTDLIASPSTTRNKFEYLRRAHSRVEFGASPLTPFLELDGFRKAWEYRSKVGKVFAQWHFTRRNIRLNARIFDPVQIQAFVAYANLSHKLLVCGCLVTVCYAWLNSTFLILMNWFLAKLSAK